MTKKRSRPAPEATVTKSMYANYLQCGGVRCPCCGSPDIEGAGSFSSDSSYVSQEINCRSCNASWSDLYELYDIGDVRVVPNEETVELGCYGIKVTHDGKGGATISSDLTDLEGEDLGVSYVKLMTAIDVLESLTLAAACAGIDIEAPAFLETIETVASKIENQYG